MSLAWLLNVIGLMLSTTAAVLMYYFPPKTQLFTQAGERVTQWVSNPIEEKKGLGVLQSRIARAAPIILAAGFLLQLASAFTSVCSGAAS